MVQHFRCPLFLLFSFDTTLKYFSFLTCKMRVLLVGLLLFGLATTFNVTSPAAGEIWDIKYDQVIRWTYNNTDPSNFSASLSNPSWGPEEIHINMVNESGQIPIFQMSDRSIALNTSYFARIESQLKPNYFNDLWELNFQPGYSADFYASQTFGIIDSRNPLFNNPTPPTATPSSYVLSVPPGPETTTSSSFAGQLGVFFGLSLAFAIGITGLVLYRHWQKGSTVLEGDGESCDLKASLKVISDFASDLGQATSRSGLASAGYVENPIRLRCNYVMHHLSGKLRTWVAFIGGVLM